MKSIFVVAVVSFELIVWMGCVEGLYKRWRPNTNFNNPSNWNAGRLPCSNDAVVFPERSPAVYIQANASLQQIVLPINGELVLADYMSFSFPQPSQLDTSCDGQELQFNGTDVHSWFDPESWCEVADPEGSCMLESQPRLHTERLPCQTDQVIFPKDSTYLVDMPSGVDVYVGKLSIRGKDYSTGDFRSYIRSSEGRKEFQQSGGTSTNVNILTSLCNDPTGCPCGNDGKLLEQKVCDMVVMSCPDVYCSTPLMPTGHCCHICGAVLKVDYGPGFKLKSLENAVHSNIPRTARDSVRVVVSKLRTEQIQITVQSLDESGQADTTRETIVNLLQPDQNGNSRYRVTKIEVTTSGDGGPVNPQAQTGGKKGMKAGSIAGIVLAVIGILAFIALAMFCLIDRKDPLKRRALHMPTLKWPFRRFGSSDDRSALELNTSVRFKDNVVMQPGASFRGFDNPSYDINKNGQTGDGNETNGFPLDISTIDLTQPTFVALGGDTGFSNPLYSDTSKIEDLSYLDSTTLKMNPVYSEDGIEADSEI